MKIALPFPRIRGNSPDQPQAARRKRPITLRAGLILAGLAALVGAGVYAWRVQTATSAGPALAAPVTIGDLTVNVESSGAVKATQCEGAR